MSATKSQRPIPSSKQTSQGTQLLWRKVNNNPKFEQATTIISNHGKKPSQTIKTEANISQFLQKLHHKLSDSMNHSQSQIIEKVSIDWGEDLGIPINSRLMTKSEAEEENLLYSQRIIRCHCGWGCLSQIRSIEEFLRFIEDININLHRQISEMVNNNINLELQCETLKHRCQKIQTDNQLLHNHVQLLQRNNIKLTEDLSSLKKQVAAQIAEEQEKIKSKYQKMFEVLKQESLKKQQEYKLTESTKYSNSIKSNNTTSNQNDRSRGVDQSQVFLNQCGEFKRAGKLTRSRGHNQRTTNFSAGAKTGSKAEDQQKTKYIGGFNKPNQNYDKIIHHILQQDRKQLRSLKLPTNN